LAQSIPATNTRLETSAGEELDMEKLPSRSSIDHALNLLVLIQDSMSFTVSELNEYNQAESDSKIQQVPRSVSLARVAIVLCIFTGIAVHTLQLLFIFSTFKRSQWRFHVV